MAFLRRRHWHRKPAVKRANITGFYCNIRPASSGPGRQSPLPPPAPGSFDPEDSPASGDRARCCPLRLRKFSRKAAARRRRRSSAARSPAGVSTGLRSRSSAMMPPNVTRGPGAVILQGVHQKKNSPHPDGCELTSIVCVCPGKGRRGHRACLGRQRYGMVPAASSPQPSCRRSSVVERALGKGEVGSSILPGGTTNSSIDRN